MEITVRGDWYQSEHGYIVALITVTNENGEMLMRDEDLYFGLEKFVSRIKKMFFIERFKWDNVVYYKKTQRIEMKGKDLRRGLGCPPK